MIFLQVGTKICLPTQVVWVPVGAQPGQSWGWHLPLQHTSINPKLLWRYSPGPVHNQGRQVSRNNKKTLKKKKKEYFFPFCLNCELGHFGVRQALAGDQGQEGEGSRTWQQQLLYQLSCSTNPPLTASAVSWLLTTVKPQNSWIYPLPPAPYWLGNYSGSFWDLL